MIGRDTDVGVMRSESQICTMTTTQAKKINFWVLIIYMHSSHAKKKLFSYSLSSLSKIPLPPLSAFLLGIESNLPADLLHS